mmetsp:Transcript_2355/g.5287  ORF Transcript_2355/g.5287 Transcript_2355/m.5287 type:complete len:213 (-) Transcript_2355:4158-4796(-)
MPSSPAASPSAIWKDARRALPAGATMGTTARGETESNLPLPCCRMTLSLGRGLPPRSGPSARLPPPATSSPDIAAAPCLSLRVCWGVPLLLLGRAEPWGTFENCRDGRSRPSSSPESSSVRAGCSLLSTASCSASSRMVCGLLSSSPLRCEPSRLLREGVPDLLRCAGVLASSASSCRDAMILPFWLTWGSYTCMAARLTTTSSSLSSSSSN